MLIETIKLWEDREDVELTTFVTLPDAMLPNQIKRPAVIVCPGGGYMSCPRHGNEGDPVAMTFAADGYQGFVLEYSVAEKAPEGKALFPAQILDFGKAILTIKEHADEWNVDADKISMIGFSAGAHLCGMLATTWHQKLLTETFHVPEETFKPLCAMLIYPLADYVCQEEYRKAGKVPPILPMDMNVPTFGCVDPSEEQLKEFSPLYQVSEQTVPTFIVAAKDDGMVPAVQSLDLAKALHLNGVPYELHMFEFGSHGFSLGRNLFEAYRTDKARTCAAWVPLAKEFLLHQVAPETAKKEEDPFAHFA